jgi:mannose-6-phosphate isomerase-like protein (cupin superfamily)
LKTTASVALQAQLAVQLLRAPQAAVPSRGPLSAGLRATSAAISTCPAAATNEPQFNLGKGRAMKGYLADIEKLTEVNDAFRQVLYTGQNLQLVLMALKPGQDIGMETHATHDQFFRLETGHGEIVIDGLSRKIKGGDGAIVPAGAQHNLINTGKKTLRLYTIYGPPNHVDQLVEAKKAQALVSTEVFDGVTTE